MATVMAVDDREDNLELIRLFVMQMGHEFIGVSTPQTVLKTVRATQPDLVLMDLALPVIDGLELTYIIKTEIDPSLPVIAVTAVPEHYTEELASEAGCDAFLSKPFSISELQSLLRTYLP